MGDAARRRWALITGCSTGIGRALVAACREGGWGAVATARRPESLSDIPGGDDLRRLRLDVTDAESVRAAAQAAADLPLYALVNNAGYGQMGPLEALGADELRAQLEANVVGLHMVTNAFLPLIRRRPGGEGRIVHIASVLGRLSIPMAGAYNASKHAVVALAETLRLEIGDRVPVILVEPGSIKSEFRANIRRAWGDLPGRLEGTPYRAAVGAYERRQELFADHHGMSAEECAQRIFRAMAAERPPRRVVIGADSFWSQAAKRIVPAALWEYALRRVFGLR
jgi:NAD(P)-dependent dehydrogenase (short-subunit alcohol dehydrogenase family)